MNKNDLTIDGRSGRGISERILIKGTLKLLTPTHLGNGDSESLTDMPLHFDVITGKPLLTGASIAGALRAYLRDVEHGYGGHEKPNDFSQSLFGTIFKNESIQSLVIIDDALGDTPGFEVRDGVAIDRATRTAIDKKKYDIQLLREGTTFEIAMELLLPDGKERDRLLAALATALQGFEKGEIGLGMRKHRGFGQCKIDKWHVHCYALTTRAGLLDWLQGKSGEESQGNDISALFKTNLIVPDSRKRFSLNGTFNIANSLLIRAEGENANDPDCVHLRSIRKNTKVPILPGTSLAGAIRARASRIANTVLETNAQKLIDGMFGKEISDNKIQPTGSRVITYETPLQGKTDLVQNRVKIDRFTGSAFPTALFAEQPVFGGPDSRIVIHIDLHQPESAEIGLMLLVLKDLWTGDLPIGGGSSVGRGFLQGKTVQLSLWSAAEHRTWNLAQIKEGELLHSGTGTLEDLEACVKAFNEYGRKI